MLQVVEGCTTFLKEGRIVMCTYQDKGQHMSLADVVSFTIFQLFGHS